MDSGGLADLSFPSSTDHRGRVQENGHICPAITCVGGVHRIMKEESDENMRKKVKYRIRRLTPKEQFALMGLPKDLADKCMEMGVSESALLKQTGNGIVTNCVTLISQHIYKTFRDRNYLCTDEKKLMKQKENKGYSNNKEKQMQKENSSICNYSGEDN